MKLRHPSLIRAAGFGLAGVLAAWLGTLRYRAFERVKGNIPGSPGQTEPFIYAFWHETLLIPAMAYRHLNAYMLVSQHADGELMAQICRHIGIKVTRGSPKRGGAASLLAMTGLLKHSHIGITP